MSCVIVLSIAVGIGVNTTVFSWIEARVLNPLPGVPRSGDLLLVEARGEHGTYPGMSWLDYRDLRDRLSSFESLIAFRMTPIAVGAAEWSERTYGVLVSGNYFPALALTPARGRLIEPRDADSDAPVAVVSHRFWQARLGGDPDVVGRSIRLNDRAFTIVGVAPREFVGTVMGLTFEIWLPATTVALLTDGTRELESRGARGYLVMGRLRDTATRAGAAAELATAMRTLAAEHPETNATITGEVLPQWQSPRGPQRSLVAALAMFQAAMLLVLAVVAGNTINLVLSRSGARQHEAAVMLALGSGRWRIVRQSLLENLVLALAGAGLGALMAMWGTTALRAVPLPSPAGLELTFHTTVDGVTLLFAAALGILCGVAIGLPAGLHLSRVTPTAGLRSTGTVSPRSGLRDAFLALEVALAVVVLVVAAGFVKTFNDTRTTDPGFDREGVLLATYDLRGRNRAIAPDAVRDFSARLLDSLRASEAVESAALATSVPLDIHGMPSRLVSVEGRVREDGELDRVLTNSVSPGYFATMRIGFVEGVDFADLRDPRETQEAVVNEAFVRQLIAPRPAIGRRVEAAGRAYTIVGVVRTTIADAFDETPQPMLYTSLRERPSAMVEVHVRSGASGASGAAGLSAEARSAKADADIETVLTPVVRRAIRELDPSLPVYNVRTLAKHVDANLVFQRIPARLFVVLGPLLLVLVAIGIYAVASHATSSRRKEIGTRLALGATRARVIRTLVAGTTRSVAIGAGGGLLAAALLVPGFATGTREELILLGAVTLMLMAAALVATWIPARRASQVDLMEVLKHE
jgi:predicted permease